MKKLLGALLVCLMATPALAGMNIGQNGDGTTDWVDSSGNRQNVGDVYLAIHMENISAASTAVIVSPITKAKVTSIRVVLAGGITGTANVLDFYITTAGNTVETNILSSAEVTNATSRMTFTAAGASVSGTVQTFTPSGNHGIEKGGVLYIHTNGASTNDVDATIVVTIEPDG